MPLNVDALNEVGRVFDWRPDPARYFASAAAEHVRHGLQKSLANGHGALVLVGEASAGKTLLMSTVVPSLPAHWVHVAQLVFTVMSGQEIATSMAYAFGMPPGPSVMSHQPPLEWIETQLRVWASCDESSLLVVDEAQNLPVDALHTLLTLHQKRLNGRPVLRLILVGQPGLLQRLNAPELAAFAADVGPHYLVPPLTPAESAGYLQHRLSQYAGPKLPLLTPSAWAEIHARSQGLPGRINVLCQQLLHSAILLESDAPIDAAEVASQADELLYFADPNAAAIASPSAGSTASPVLPEMATVPTPTPAAPSLIHHGSSPQPKASAPVPAHESAEALPFADASAERHTPPVQNRSTPVARGPLWSTAFAAAALLLGAIWFYVQSPTGQPMVAAAVAAKTPAAVPKATAPVIAAPPHTQTTAPQTAETAQTAAPETADLLAAPATSAALASSTPANPLPKDLAHAPPIETTPETKPAPPKATPKTTSTDSVLHAAPSSAVAAESAPMAKRSAPKNTHAQCTSLLAQMSLGEPLTAKQQRVLETQCR